LQKLLHIPADWRILLSFEAFSKQAVLLKRHLKENQSWRFFKVCAQPWSRLRIDHGEAVVAARQPVIAQDVATISKFLDHSARLS
jgi:hypothetical protein